MTTPPRPTFNNPGIVAAGVAANQRRARDVGQRQAEQAQAALAVLDPTTTTPVHLAVLRHRADHPTASLRELATSMDPPLTKDAFAAHLRRALRCARHLQNAHA